MRIRYFIDAFLLLWAALLLAWVGMAMPIHFRAVSPLILEEAGKGTPKPIQLADELLAAGKVGPVLVVKNGAGVRWGTPQEARVRRLLEENAEYRFSGGPAPYFIQFLKQASLHLGESPEMIPLMLPRARREALEGFLKRSSNQLVLDVLRSAELSGWQMFLPVYSDAGHPLHATLLTTALLEQSGHFSPRITRELRERLSLVFTDPGRVDLVRDLERAYLAVFSLGTRLQWGALTEVIAVAPDMEVLYGMAALMNQDPESGRLENLYTALLLTGEAAGLVDYLQRQEEEGWRALQFALSLGEGAVRELLTFEKPLYEPSLVLQWLSPSLLKGGERLKGFARGWPGLAFAMKLGCLFGAGFCLTLIFSRGAEHMRQRRPVPLQNAAFLARNAAVALVVAILLWVAIEPEMLQFQENRESILLIDMANVVGSASLSTPGQNSAMIDQASLISLILFFVIQATVFIFGLIRIREIKRQQGDPELKLRLLDNEENLFDLGLYVGLGGTVTALVLIALNVVEASLMVAYASTLFGIVFVACLKVMILRPYRRNLILEASRASVATSLLASE